jgi:hypothetical protein
MQANGAEMMRLAACLATERGVEVCAPVHDAFLICVPLDRLDEDVATMLAAMAEASRIVLGGFELGTDVAITRWPDRYTDARGSVMWQRVLELLDRSEQRQTAYCPVRRGTRLCPTAHYPRGRSGQIHVGKVGGRVSVV